MYSEDDFIHIGALQHYVFCPRQCALIHVEDVWSDNVFTVRGNLLHEKADTDTYETRESIKTVRGLRVHSYQLGLVGRCDVVEFRRTNKGEEVFPVEFKAGKQKDDLSDRVQLCAQALCLEEMLNVRVDRGAFFYGKIRRRVLVDIDEQLRSATKDVIQGVRDIVSRRVVPTARYMRKCKHCSLEQICQPKAMNQRRLHTYMEALYSP